MVGVSRPEDVTDDDSLNSEGELGRLWRRSGGDRRIERAGQKERMRERWDSHTALIMSIAILDRSTTAIRNLHRHVVHSEGSG
jgi:hypothetical protein